MNAKDHEQLTEDLYYVRKVNPELLTEGFRWLHKHKFKQDIGAFFRGHSLFQKLFNDEAWIQANIRAIVEGEKNPKVFLMGLRDKLREFETEKYDMKQGKRV